MSESEYWARLAALVQRDAERTAKLDALIQRIIQAEQSLAALWSTKGQ